MATASNTTSTSTSTSANKSSIKVFDPRQQFKSAEDAASAKVVWSSESIRLAYDAIDTGLPLRANPFFKGNIYVRRAGLLYAYEKWEEQEWLKCKFDILYYADTYVTLMTPDGVKKRITLRKYQRKMLRAFQRHKYVIVLTGRQIGKTTTTAIFLSWCAIFCREMTIAVLGDKRETSMENLNKTKDIIYNLPFFLKPGAFVWNSMTIAFDNGCKIMTGSCSKSALVGKTVHVLYIDELAIPPASQSKELVEYALPTINSLPTGKFIATSTPSGDNIFKKLWLGAINKENGFFAIQVNWWDVPGRDDKWKQEQLAILGEDAFNEQYNCVFLSGSTSVLATHAIDAIARRLRDYVLVPHARLDNVLRYLMFDKDVHDTMEPNLFMQWHKDINIEQLKNEVCFVTIDIGEGLNQDYSVMHFFRLVKTQKVVEVESYDEYDDFTDEERAAFREAVDFAHKEALASNAKFEAYKRALLDLDDDNDEDADNDDWIDSDEYVDYDSDDAADTDISMMLNTSAEEIGLFRSNVTSIKVLALYLQFLLKFVFDAEKFKIVFERNKYGGEFKSYCSLERAKGIAIDEEMFACFPSRLGSEKLVAGITITPGTKPLYVRAFKDATESSKLILNNIETQRECQYFGKLKNGSYGASPGFHDDIAMTCVHAAAFMDERNADWLALVDILYSLEAHQAQWGEDSNVDDVDDGYGI